MGSQGPADRLDLAEARALLGVGANASASDVEAAYWAKVDGVSSAAPDADAVRRRIVVARNVLFGRPPDAPAPTERPAPSVSTGWVLEDAPPTAGQAAKATKAAASAPTPSTKASRPDSPASAATRSATSGPSSTPAQRPAAAPARRPAAPQTPAAGPATHAPSKPSSSASASSAPAAASSAEESPPRRGKRLLLVASGGVVLVVAIVAFLLSGSSKGVEIPRDLTADIASMKRALDAAPRSTASKSLEAAQEAAAAAEKDALARAERGDETAIPAMRSARDLWRTAALARVVEPAAAKAEKARAAWLAIAKHLEAEATAGAAADAAYKKASDAAAAQGVDLKAAASAYVDAERRYLDAAAREGKTALRKIVDSAERRARDTQSVAKAAVARAGDGESAVAAAIAELNSAVGPSRVAVSRKVVRARLAARSLAAERNAFEGDRQFLAQSDEGTARVRDARKAEKEGRTADMAENAFKAQAASERMASRAARLRDAVETILNPPSVASPGVGSYALAAGPASGLSPALLAALGSASIRLDLAQDRTFSFFGRVGAATGFASGRWGRLKDGSVRLEVWEEDDARQDEPRALAATITLDETAKTFAFAAPRSGDDAGVGLVGDLRPLLRAALVDLRLRWRATGLLRDDTAAVDAATGAATGSPSATPESARSDAKRVLGAAGDGDDLVRAQTVTVGAILEADRVAAEAKSPRREAAARDLGALDTATRAFSSADSPRDAYAPALPAIAQAEAGLAAAADAPPDAASPLAGRYSLAMDAWPAPPKMKAGLEGGDVVLDLRRDGLFTLATLIPPAGHSWAGAWSPFPAVGDEDAVSLSVLADGREVLGTPRPSTEWWVKLFPKKGTFAFRTARFGGQIPWATAVEALVPAQPRPLVLKEPPAAAVFGRDAKLLVRGTVVPEAGAVLSVNGKETPVAKNEFSTQLPVPDGETSLRIEVTYGVETSSKAVARTVDVDTLAPRVTVTEPVAGEPPGSDVVPVVGGLATLRGEVVDAHLERVTANGVALALHSEGGGRWSFSTVVRVPGPDEVTVVIAARDSLGNESAAVSRRFRRAASLATETSLAQDETVVLPASVPSPREPSALVVDAPLDGGVVPAGALAVEGRLRGAHKGDSVTVNGTAVKLEGSDDPSFSTSLEAAPPGWRVVVVEVVRDGVPLPDERVVRRVLAGP